MVQNISQNKNNNNSSNMMGSVNKIGTTQNGRIVYELLDGTGKVGGKISVGSQHADSFERTYKTISDIAPKIQKYQQELTPRKIEKLKSGSKWAKWGLTLTGFAVPAIFVLPKNEKWATLIQAVATIGGTIAGFIGGQILGAKIMTPPGGIELTKATQTLQKLDIQPYMNE